MRRSVSEQSELWDCRSEVGIGGFLGQNAPPKPASKARNRGPKTMQLDAKKRVSRAEKRVSNHLLAQLKTKCGTCHIC